MCHLQFRVLILSTSPCSIPTAITGVGFLISLRPKQMENQFSHRSPRLCTLFAGKSLSLRWLPVQCENQFLHLSRQKHAHPPYSIKSGWSVFRDSTCPNSRLSQAHSASIWSLGSKRDNFSCFLLWYLPTTRSVSEIARCHFLRKGQQSPGKGPDSGEPNLPSQT